MITTPGNPAPLGLSQSGNITNFAISSCHAEKIILGLFQQDSRPIKEFSLHRTADRWHIGIADLPDGLSYAYRCEGPEKLLYQPGTWLTDPYAKIIRQKKAKATVPAPFNWQDDTPPRIPLADLIIYEMHIRGFSKHSSSKVKHPGTYLGMIEKIPYLKRLGINAVELMPIFGFDHSYIKHIHSDAKEKRVNYWGYNPLHFFCPTDWYAVDDPVHEFKMLVRELHKQNIEVILDVVFNHTGEEDNKSYYVNFRGIDNATYYLLGPDGKYLNFTGCGNTLNTNHPIVQTLILDSLRYWIEEMHVDGFRFDLASILTRDSAGHPLSHPPILQAILEDPVICQVKLIAEPWDAAGLYQIGSFPKWGPWSEWNGKYRDIARKFIKGTNAKARLFGDALCGSEKIYHSSKTPLSSVNFITAHDGFTLRDLVTYQQKHNYENGEANRDGSDHNDSWNCGHEGPTDDSKINELRERQMRNFLLALFISQGIPMILMGDEYGHTRHGNNNPYVQDNEINWFLWDQENPKMLSFFSSLIAFRAKHPHLHRTRFLTDLDVEWFNSWDDRSREVAFLVKGTPSLYVAFNANYLPCRIDLPKGDWHLVIHTEEDWIFHQNGPLRTHIELPPYSAVLCRTGFKI